MIDCEILSVSKSVEEIDDKTKGAREDSQFDNVSDLFRSIVKGVVMGGRCRCGMCTLIQELLFPDRMIMLLCGVCLIVLTVHHQQ